ncbi:MAG: hypothetical protein KF788_21065 [Piscinibacter sp.]|nr:hypothetical protein [Piscinibacter sp.]
MKLGKLKSVGHNIADSLASGIGLMIGVYTMDVFAEAAGEDEGFVVVDFLNGVATGRTVSDGFRKAVALYRDALPELCSKHAVDPADFKRLDVRYGTDPVYGPHFKVSVEAQSGQRSTDQYVGIPGRRLRRRR